MTSAALLRSQIESALAPRVPAAFSTCGQSSKPLQTTGLEALDHEIARQVSHVELDVVVARPARPEEVVQAGDLTGVNVSRPLLPPATL